MALLNKLKTLALPEQTSIGKMARLLYNQPSLLTPANMQKMARRIRQRGLDRVYEEEIRKCWEKAADVKFDEEAEEPIINGRGSGVGAIVNEDVPISVVIPVKDVGPEFRGLLSLLKAQKGFRQIEIVVVDSGSTDRTPEISRQFGAKLIEIPPSQFSHSYARNLGADHAAGDFFCFTVQDALPTSDLWLYELVSVLKHNDVAAVSCSEQPREDADLFYRMSLWNHYRFLGVESRDRILRKPRIENFPSLRKNAQLSNLACVMPRDTFLKYKFRGDFAEDVDLGLRLIRDGHRLAMLSSTKVIHSHSRPAYYYLRRGFVDTLWMIKIFGNAPVQPVDPEKLFSEFVSVTDTVRALARDELDRLALPCSVEDLSDFVLDRLHEASLKTSFSPCFQYGECDDDQFRSFLQRMQERPGHNGVHSVVGDGPLFRGVESFVKIGLDYIRFSYERVDNKLLEELKMFLPKASAFQFGSHLGASLSNVSEATRQEYQEIVAELRRGV